ncbi:hypothetical protein [Thiosulfatihalobacter marinus]|uniref:hypothetical protein n=1 Tax=Thiosulfatihalobacter marinus TaxID=2792481 RepID=UPI0018D9C63F|nr:hypothetical protein [Thiosulfatihalobacter marinus]
MTAKQYLFIAVLGIASLVVFYLTETAAQERHATAPRFAAIGADLGVRADQVAACFPGSDLSGGGQPARRDMRAVAACLKSADAGLSDAQIAQALAGNAPVRGGRGQNG